MLSARSTHYWLWFILFGVVSSLVVWRLHGSLDTASVWLLVTGLLGVLLGVGGLGARLSRPYDLVIGLLFTAIGLLGLLHNLGYNLVPTTSETATTIGQSAILGLSLALPYALIHTLLGLTSLNHGLRAKAHTPTVMVDASSNAA